MTFSAWLGQQTARTDDIGIFARYAVKDKVFPKRDALYLCLLRYEGMPAQRRGVKLAHREYRRWRKGVNAHP
jgi:hypothetical protein